MTWPTSSKASTSNVDQASDRISDARTDILQNIQNTNAIINKFDLTSLADGEILLGTGSNTLANRPQIAVSPYFAYVVYGGQGTFNMTDGGVGEDSSSELFKYVEPTQKFDPEDKLNISGFDSTNDSSSISSSVFISEAGTYSFFIQESLMVSDHNHDTGDFGIIAIKPDGTTHDSRVSTEDASELRHPTINLAVFKPSVGLYNLTLPAQSIIRTFISTNQRTFTNEGANGFVMKVIKDQ